MSIWSTVKSYASSVGVGVRAAKAYIQNVKARTGEAPSLSDVVSSVGRSATKKSHQESNEEVNKW